MRVFSVASRFPTSGSSQKSSKAIGKTKGRPAIPFESYLPFDFIVFKHVEGEAPKPLGSWWVVDLEVEKYLKREAHGVEAVKPAVIIGLSGVVLCRLFMALLDGCLSLRPVVSPNKNGSKRAELTKRKF